MIGKLQQLGVLYLGQGYRITFLDQFIVASANVRWHALIDRKKQLRLAFRKTRGNPLIAFLDNDVLADRRLGRTAVGTTPAADGTRTIIRRPRRSGMATSSPIRPSTR